MVVVDDHDAIAGFDASLEHIAVGHHRLAIETGQRGNVRMRSRGDDHDVGRRVEHVLRRRLDASPKVDAELLHLTRQEARDPCVLGLCRSPRGDQHLARTSNSRSMSVTR